MRIKAENVGVENATVEGNLKMRLSRAIRDTFPLGWYFVFEGTKLNGCKSFPFLLTGSRKYTSLILLYRMPILFFLVISLRLLFGYSDNALSGRKHCGTESNGELRRQKKLTSF